MQHHEEVALGGCEEPLLAIVRAHNRVCKRVKAFANDKLDDVPLDQESVEAQVSLALLREEILSNSLVIAPLHHVAAGVQHVNHDEDAEAEAIVQDEGIWVEVLCRASSCLPAESDKTPVYHMEAHEGFEQFGPQWEVPTLGVAHKHVQNAEAKVVRHGLKRDQWADLLGSEFVSAHQAHDQSAEQEADLSGNSHRLLALSPGDGSLDGLKNDEARLRQDEHFLGDGERARLNFVHLLGPGLFSARQFDFVCHLNIFLLHSSLQSSDSRRAWPPLFVSTQKQTNLIID